MFAQVNKDSLNILVNRHGRELMKERQTVGLSIGIYSNDKSYFYNFGTIEKNKQSAPTKNTVYEIGSITKTFVSFLLAKAVTEKRVNLSDDIRKYLKGEFPNLEYSNKPIRLIHLANTTSGLPDWLPELPDTSVKQTPVLSNTFYKNVTRQVFFSALQKVKLDTVPGSYAKHSNAGAILLSYILETIYNKPLSTLLQEYITIPYKMRNTSFFPLNNLAKGYNSEGKEVPYALPFFNATGGLFSTTEDLLKYSKVLLDSHNTVAEKVLQRNIQVDMQRGKVKDITPDSSYNPASYDISLSWFSYKFDNGIVQIWADGGTTGFCSYLVLLPQLKSTIVLLANANDEKVFRALPNIAYSIIDLMGKK